MKKLKISIRYLCYNFYNYIKIHGLEVRDLNKILTYSKDFAPSW